MSKHRWTVEAEIDDGLLAERRAEEPDGYPLVDKPSEFTWTDLEETIGQEIAVDPEVVAHEEVG